jgi:signal transduction histidine kinase
MRVLVVDARSPDLQAALAGLPCELVQARGDEALRWLADDEVAAAVIAVEAGATDGYQLARRARAELSTRKVPFIFVATTLDQTALRGFDAGTFELLVGTEDRQLFGQLLRNKVQLFLDLAASRRRVADEAIAHRRVVAELEAFHHAVAHDLRASLRPLDGLSEALLGDYGDDLDGQEKTYLTRIRTAAARMERLIDNLMQLARVGHAAVHRQPLDLSELVGSVVDELRADDPDLPLDFVPAPGLTTHADGRLLRIAIENVLRSTRARAGKRIELGRKTGDEPVFFIRDVDPSRGIPHAIVDRVIHRHDGRAWTESSPDRGATFYFTLPDARH